MGRVDNRIKLEEHVLGTLHADLRETYFWQRKKRRFIRQCIKNCETKLDKLYLLKM